MARFVRGDVVVVPFPVTGSTRPRPRPALVVASWPTQDGTDYLVCVIASQPAHDPHFMELTPDDFEFGPLNRAAYLRPSYIFTIDEAGINRRVGALHPEKLDAVLSTLAALFR